MKGEIFMNCHQIHQIYFSPSGTTKTIVESITSSFPQEKETYDLLKTSQPQAQTFTDTDCVVIGMPVFAGRIPALCVESIKKFKGTGTPAIAIVAYGNREYEDALLELTDMLKSNGFIIISAATFVAQHSIFPTVAKGRPDKEDFMEIERFSAHCFDKLNVFSSKRTNSVEVKGNHPYRDPSALPLKLTVNSKCTNCHVCAQTCPVHAISSDDPTATDETCCISCTACIAACPEHARKFRNPLYTLARAKFEKKCTLRKEPEFFL